MDLNAKLAKLEALSDKLGEEIKELSDAIEKLNAARAEAEKNRKEEKEENTHTIMEAKAGLEAVTMAIDILDKFYKTAKKGGIVGMLEVIQSDFERTIKETAEAEKKAAQDHLDFMTETGKSLQEKEVALKEKTKLKDEADQNIADSNEKLDSEMEIMVTTIKELIELKATCIDTGMSYAERVALREEEIAALKKALCILTAYAEYGPDGLSDAC